MPSFFWLLSIALAAGSHASPESSLAVSKSQCHAEAAVKVFLRCGRDFYSEVPLVTNRTVLVLATLCPQVDKYAACVYRSREGANCSGGTSPLPHMNYVAESLVGRYRTLCRALQHAVRQKTTACNRKRFINDMFLCGYHFSNIVEVLGNKPSPTICPYLDKYRKCHNDSIESFGCAPPEQLYEDANMFFKALTRRFATVCSQNDTTRGVVARLTLDEKQRSCDTGRFMRDYFECSNKFLKGVNASETGREHICRVASIYRHCVSGSRYATHCNTGMELNSHLAYLQNYVLAEYTASCVYPGSRPEKVPSRPNYVPLEYDDQAGGNDLPALLPARHHEPADDMRLPTTRTK